MDGGRPARAHRTKDNARPEGVHHPVTAEANREITDLVETGHLVPVIGPGFPLAEAAAAVQLVEEGSPPGKVVVPVD